MRNYKLLLATTAILSMGAMAANALTGESTDVPVKAEIIHARVLTPSPIDFGRIVVADDIEELEVNINSVGVETINAPDDTGGYILTTGSKGEVAGASCSQLNWKQDFSCYGNQDQSVSCNMSINPPTGTTVVYATLENFRCVDNASGDATFYGDLHILANDSIPAGNYTGSFTATAIYPVETPSSGN